MKQFRIYYVLKDGVGAGATANMTYEQVNTWLEEKSAIVSNSEKMWLIDLSNSTDTRLI